MNDYDAGSSVPEAARAAAFGTYQPWFDKPDTAWLTVVDTVLAAAAPFIVAAAVAEERADLAAQIEALAPEPVAGDVYRTGQWRAFMAAADWVRTGQLSRRV